MNILISALNWGLGHAARIVPIVEILISEGFRVFLASDGRSYFFLKKRFPQLPVLEAPKLDVKYSVNAGIMPLKIFFQMPEIWLWAKKDYRWLQRVVKKYKIDLVISDNRYGMVSRKVPSIFITHQLNIQVPENMNGAKKIVDKLNANYVCKFDEIWIPDFEDCFRVSGILSENKLCDKKITYLGILSRFINFPKINFDPKFDVLFIVSGNEPQRTYFQELVVNQLKTCELDAVVFCGKTEKFVAKQEENILFLSHIEDETFIRYLFSSNVIIARSGYSTIMDLITVGRTGILIPTPMQTEQMYLAEYLSKNEIFHTVNQEELNLVLDLDTFRWKRGWLQSNIEKVNKCIDYQKLKQTVITSVKRYL